MIRTAAHELLGKVAVQAEVVVAVVDGPQQVQHEIQLFFALRQFGYVPPPPDARSRRGRGARHGARSPQAPLWPRLCRQSRFEACARGAAPVPGRGRAARAHWSTQARYAVGCLTGGRRRRGAAQTRQSDAHPAPQRRHGRRHPPQTPQCRHAASCAARSARAARRTGIRGTSASALRGRRAADPAATHAPAASAPCPGGSAAPRYQSAPRSRRGSSPCTGRRPCAARRGPSRRGPAPRPRARAPTRRGPRTLRAAARAADAPGLRPARTFRGTTPGPCARGKTPRAACALSLIHI